ncbi:hypothetical protein FGG90_15265 [Clavibacter tessellarius]|uniref:Uncharacterized protein n=1 Tax=Clavibacter tessellarius TaxID=31965 RepID=A0A225CJ66_9MICO|nr:hypothetical protein [Clavibacter michiganensis]OQJ61802.1 hypothetical protein B5P24_01510 [Clavibacter michiganensis subsp. tessellarius]UKF35207.1 hypothetical protein FGG90_15265 [Clavibacter michiganensis subsp. tessellarius]
MQIDQLAWLGWTWQRGEDPWIGERREQLATDFQNRQAVDDRTDKSKADQGPVVRPSLAAGFD